MKKSVHRSAKNVASADGGSMAAAWRTLEACEAVERLDSRQTGLTNTEAAERIEQFGSNIIEIRRPDGPVRLLLRQLSSYR